MLTINKKQDDNHILLSLKGQVDASNSVELDEAIKEVVTQNHPTILVDGSELEYISSAGLGVFMSYLEEFEENNIQFLIYGLSEKVANVFHILGLDQLITIKANKDEALQTIHEA
ncbi:anti-sigma factor antagonist [Echinicola strongylocentroti]|uniref:Anti-sigma factor antagonist n=1 Tax=Echinicola strongylocentroti TaxID=1795355 RepID=A0A2Z4IHX9_9BACT|nr:STAS domain-containing protein [Echinicola strongylocentroti]AWW30339.1 anti-sigma factor antagonist [Echinicola strongylocentroti]